MHLKIKLSSMQGRHDLRKKEDILQLAVQLFLFSLSVLTCLTNCLAIKLDFWSLS